MTAVGRFSTRPLYLQVKDMLVQRIIGGTWKPGAAIPNEIELSRELGISVGTVRKALDEMEGERLILRRQGRGTFVIDQTSDECANRFSNIRDAEGSRISGDIQRCELISTSANEDEARMLNLIAGDPVFRINRVRTNKGAPFMVEQSTMPQSGFAGLTQEAALAPSIVVLAQNYRILLTRAEEKVSVTTASIDVAANLKVAEGTPLLKLDRVIFAIDGRPIEWRIGRCYLRDNAYLAEVS